MKTLIYTAILIVCAFILVEPKDSYQSPELPEIQLQANESLPVSKPQKIDTIIINIEKNLNYLKNTRITEN